MRFISVALMCILLVGCGGETTSSTEATGAKPEQTFQWKLVTTWPKNFPGLGLAPENFAKNVERMSNGRLKIKVYGAGQLVPAL